MDNNFRQKENDNSSEMIFPAIRPYNSPAGERRRRRIPTPINRFYIPLAVLETTSRFLQKYGIEHRECYVWWGGYFTADGDGQVTTAICPEIDSTFGHIHLNNRQLLLLHSQLRDLDQVLLVELHTHPPGAEGQNDVDALNPASTHPGFISIIVPDFAFPLFYDLGNAHLYEYKAYCKWRKLKTREITERFVIEETSFTIEVRDGTI